MAESYLSLADVVRQHRDPIVSRFVVEIERKALPPGELSRPALVDHIPAFLDDVARELDSVSSVRTTQDAIDTSAIARDHGEQRWALGYDLEALIREYGVLRHAILAIAKDVGAWPTVDEFEVLSKCLNVGVAEAAMAYTRQRDAEVSAQRDRLEFLAEAGEVLAASLDHRSTTSCLTRIVVPRMADWCAIHLDGVAETEMPIAHVDPTKLELLRHALASFRPRDTDHGYRAVYRTGEPVLVSENAEAILEQAAASPEHLAVLRELAAKSWILVPLRTQQQTLGVLMLAYSESGRRYDSNDLALATELARRAASAIDNAQLFALSQRERARVEAATRAKDEFVAMVSHELRTPLNAILGWLRLMRKGLLDESRREHALEVIERNAETQERLVSNLLDISRMITGNLRITQSQLDLSDAVDMALEAVRPAAEAKRLALTVDLDREGAILRGDAERLRQVVWNLLANAVKFTPKDGAVHVHLRRIGSDIELVVEDNGEGIEPSFLPHVFEIFQQYDRSVTRPHGGLGIGLSIVKHIVDLHGGVITAESEGKGKGARFSLRIPISPLVSTTFGVSRVSAMAPPRDTTSLPTGLTDIEVLVVEDDRDARELIVYVLESCGMIVRSAGSTAEALVVLEAHRPTVICSDIGLADQDGYALIRHIRALGDAETKIIPAIALTANGRNDDRKRALIEGFNLHLTKPVDPMTLVRAVLDLAGRGVT